MFSRNILSFHVHCCLPHSGFVIIDTWKVLILAYFSDLLPSSCNILNLNHFFSSKMRVLICCLLRLVKCRSLVTIGYH